MKFAASSTRVRKSLALVLSLGQVSLFTLVPALAADATVRVAGNSVFNISGPVGSASERAAKIQSNIDNSLVAASSHGPSSVKITYVKGLPVLSLGGYYISTVDNATAKAAGTTPTLLAQKWAASLKSALANQKSVDAYIAQLTGSDNSSSSYSEPVASAAESSASYAPETAPAYASASPAQNVSQLGWQPMPANNANYSASPAYTSPSYSAPTAASFNGPSGYASQSMYQGRVSYVPAGMVIPVKLATGLSSGVAKAGDLVVAKTTEDIVLANGVIPANSTLTGQVSDAANGAWLGRSGKLSIKFTSIRTPNGVETPITAHIEGSIGKYADKDNDVFSGENLGSKVKKTMVSTAVGAGGGSALGVAVGAIAAGGRGVGRGAWSGAAIGAGVGLAQGLVARKGSEVNMMQGEIFKLQLDAPVSIAMN